MSDLKDKLVLTNNTGLFTTKQRIFYESNGYVVFPKLVPPSVLKKCNQRFEYLAQERKSDVPFLQIIRDVSNKNIVTKMHDISFDEIFRTYVTYKSVLDAVQSITGPNIMSIHGMFIAKPPDLQSNNSRHPPHQDLLYFPLRPAAQIVGAWTAIERTDKANGCLYVSPGSHLLGKLFDHTYPKDNNVNNSFYFGIHDLPKNLKWVDLEMEPGDTVIFHPLLIHGSGPNNSKGTRKAISCHYAATECQFIDITGTPQEMVAKEIVETVHKKTKYAVEATYQDIWAMKSHVVRGTQSSL